MAYTFDPELAAYAKSIPASSFDNPVAARQYFENISKLFAANIDSNGLLIAEHQVPGYGDAPAVRVRVYRPAGLKEKSPAILQIHGGGFVIGSLETEHALAVRNAQALGVTVVSVDYRLAPEHPYPAALHDCYAVLVWMHARAEQLQIDARRIALYGVSAGGGLAAALTLLAKEKSGPSICFQFLSIPELDDRLSTASAQAFTDTPVWNRPIAESSWQHYLGPDYVRGADNVPALAAPARAEDLSGLPPAYINTMEFDPLRDEGLLYALRLMQAGVSVEMHNYPGTFHGSVMFAAQVSKRQHKDSIAALRQALGLSRTERIKQLA